MATVVVKENLAPVMSRYVGEIERHARSWPGRARGGGPRTKPVQVRVMQSNGGVLSAKAAAREPVRTILSGPAGGVLGAQHVAGLAGFERIITFDMGGTSTDVALMDPNHRDALPPTSDTIASDLPT